MSQQEIDREIDAQVGKVMMPGVQQWMEAPAEGDGPQFALHVYAMLSVSARTWGAHAGSAPECMVTILSNDKERLRAMANEFNARGIWIDDELWPPHQLHHFWIENMSPSADAAR